MKRITLLLALFAFMLLFRDGGYLFIQDGYGWMKIPAHNPVTLQVTSCYGAVLAGFPVDMVVGGTLVCEKEGRCEPCYRGVGF